MRPVPLAFFTQDALVVAQQLLGKVVSYGGCSGMVVETEAYKDDPASHGYTRTPRSQIMFSTYGKWYIYLIYGMYHCMNLTTNGAGEVGAVLIRALEPLEGIELMKKRRKTHDVYNLCSGPGKVCQALGVDKRLNGTSVDKEMKLFEHKTFNTKDIVATSRIGIIQGKELLWRFYVEWSEFVSGR